MNRLEYSPIIIDDTERSEGEGNIFGGDQSNLDTSRFAPITYQQDESEMGKSFRSDISNLTRLIDPHEHFKTLKSPINSPHKKKKYRIQHKKQHSEI